MNRYHVNKFFTNHFIDLIIAALAVTGVIFGIIRI